MQKISLRKMTPFELEEYLKIAVPAYAAEKERGEGMTPEMALKVATDSYAKLLPDGLGTPDQFLFTVLESQTNRSIGTLWFANKTDTGKPQAWIYDIVLEAEVRGRGYGRMLMALLEAEVRKLEILSMALHVFGHNKIAISLYEKSGFRTTNIIMAKDLTSP